MGGERGTRYVNVGEDRSHGSSIHSVLSAISTSGSSSAVSDLKHNYRSCELSCYELCALAELQCMRALIQLPAPG